MSYRALILDLDNTLYDFDTYYAKSIRAMLHALARKLGAEEGLLTKQMRDVFTKHGSLEYAFVIQELDAVRELSLDDDDLQSLIAFGTGAFRRLRRKYLKPYAGVRETLKWAKEEGLVLIGLSDAPFFAAEGRLRHMKLDGYFAELYSWEGYSVPVDSYAKPYKPRIGRRVELGSEQKKPDPRIVLQILDRHRLAPESVCLVGDRLTRDIVLAKNAGIVSIWARYGTNISEKTACVLMELIPWETEARQRELDAVRQIHPDHVIDEFSAVRDIVSPQLRLL